MPIMSSGIWSGSTCNHHRVYGVRGGGGGRMRVKVPSPNQVQESTSLALVTDHMRVSICFESRSHNHIRGQVQLHAFLLRETQHLHQHVGAG